VHESHSTVLQKGGADKEPMIVRLLDERDDSRHSGRLFGQAQKPRIVDPHRHLGGQVLQLISGQAQFRKDDKAGTPGPGRRQTQAVSREVVVEDAKTRRKLRQCDAKRMHVRSLSARQLGGGYLLSQTELRTSSPLPAPTNPITYFWAPAGTWRR